MAAGRSGSGPVHVRGSDGSGDCRFDEDDRELVLRMCCVASESGAV